MVDPIDGSLNARRALPAHSLSVAVASGPSMEAVEFGYVYDFGAGEEFAARRGAGATLDGQPDRGRRRQPRPELLGVESAEPGRLRPIAEELAGRVFRLRVIGSIAISASYVAAGRLDAMLSLRPCRSVDAAAAQLIVREAGGAVAFGDLALGGGRPRPRGPLPDRRRSRAAGARDGSGVTPQALQVRNGCSRNVCSLDSRARLPDTTPEE